MTVREALKERRSARLFNGKKVSKEILDELVDCARLSPSAANLQPLRYGIISDLEFRKKIYPHVRYAGYVKDWDPSFEETPTAFIAVFCDKRVRSVEQCQCDGGLAMMAISLRAHELGLGSCILGAIDRTRIKELMGVGDELDLMYLVGLGYSDGESRVYDSDDAVKYSMTVNGGFEVPKRSLGQIIIKKI